MQKHEYQQQQPPPPQQQQQLFPAPQFPSELPDPNHPDHLRMQLRRAQQAVMWHLAFAAELERENQSLREALEGATTTRRIT